MIKNAHISLFPPEENCTLWRYMDLTKLLSLLEKRKLYFNRADRFEDPYEGVLPRVAVESLRNPLTNRGISSIEEYLRFSEIIRKTIYINCWCASEYESAAMWKLYLKSDEGVALKTDYDTLLHVLENSGTSCRTSMVQYIDYDNDAIPSTNMLNTFVYKRLSFSHENELRAIIWSGDNENIGKIDIAQKSVEINIDPELLIKDVHVSPSAPEWFGNLVESLLLNRYGLTVNVDKSKLYERQSY